MGVVDEVRPCPECGTPLEIDVELIPAESSPEATEAAKGDRFVCRVKRWCTAGHHREIDHRREPNAKLAQEGKPGRPLSICR